MCRTLMILEFPSVRMNRRGVLARPPKRQTYRGRGESRALRLHAAFAVDHRVHFSSSSAATPAFLHRRGAPGPNIPKLPPTSRRDPEYRLRRLPPPGTHTDSLSN